MGYMEQEMDRHIEGAQRAEDQLDQEAIVWAYDQCVALGLETASPENARIMARLKKMLGEIQPEQGG